MKRPPASSERQPADKQTCAAAAAAIIIVVVVSRALKSPCLAHNRLRNSLLASDRSEPKRERGESLLKIELNLPDALVIFLHSGRVFSRERHQPSNARTISLPGNWRPARRKSSFGGGNFSLA